MEMLVICGMDLAKDIREMLAGTEHNGFSSPFKLMYVTVYKKACKKYGDNLQQSVVTGQGVMVLN